MKKELVDLIVIVVLLLLSGLSAFISKLRLSNKNNKMLKIIDTLIIIAEYTGLKGEDKKEFVMKAFNDFKVGKIDNVNEYINDKVDLANTINVKQSLVNQVISEEMNELHEKQVEEFATTITEEDINKHFNTGGNVKMIQLEHENDSLKKRLAIAENEIIRLQQVKVELVEKLNQANNIIKLREEQLLKIRG